VKRLVVHEEEYYPHLVMKELDDSSSLRPDIEVSDDVYAQWKAAEAAFFEAQGEIESCKRQKEFKEERVEWFTKCFGEDSPSRTDKAYLLRHFGWKQVEISVWEKGGEELRLHEAFSRCRVDFFARGLESVR